MRDHAEKVFEASSGAPGIDGPGARLVYVSFPDNPNAELVIEERSGDGWERAGVLELTVGPIHEYGMFESKGPLLEWAWTDYFGSGDRVKVEERLVIDRDKPVPVEIRHEQRREMVLGPEARREQREHDWRVQDAWSVSREGVEDVHTSEASA